MGILALSSRAETIDSAGNYYQEGVRSLELELITEKAFPF
jgi:hypothetical protein